MYDTVDRLAGTLLGTALGDALGLPAEGMSAKTVRRRFGRVDRFRLLGRTGFVSDDTEQSALVAQSIGRSPADPARAARLFRWSLIGWFLRLPWGIGLATLRACLRGLLGFRPSGVRSAGNGSAMRSAVIGVRYADEPEFMKRFAVEISEVTHTDERAVDGSVFVASLAAACARASSTDSRPGLVESACGSIREPSLVTAIGRAQSLAAAGAPIEEATAALGTSGFVMHTIPFAVFCFLRFGDQPLRALTETISGGGDTDSIGAIVGAWVGTLHGASRLPGDLIALIHDGPFGPSHLRALAKCLASGSTEVPTYSIVGALARNLALYPVVLAHGFRRLVPI